MAKKGRESTKTKFEVKQKWRERIQKKRFESYSKQVVKHHPDSNLYFSEHDFANLMSMYDVI